MLNSTIYKLIGRTSKIKIKRANWKFVKPIKILQLVILILIVLILNSPDCFSQYSVVSPLETKNNDKTLSNLELKLTKDKLNELKEKYNIEINSDSVNNKDNHTFKIEYYQLNSEELAYLKKEFGDDMPEKIDPSGAWIYGEVLKGKSKRLKNIIKNLENLTLKNELNKNNHLIKSKIDSLKNSNSKENLKKGIIVIKDIFNTFQKLLVANEAAKKISLRFNNNLTSLESIDIESEDFDTEIKVLIARNDSLNNTALYSQTVSKWNNDLLVLKTERVLTNKYRDLLFSINSLTGTPRFWRSFIPLRDNSDTDFYYDNIDNRDIKLFQNVVIQGAPDKSVVASEVLTGYFSIFRLNLSTVLYNTNESDTAATLVDKIYNGGGLLSANLNYPLFFRKWTEFAIVLDANFKGSADFNSFGNELPKNELIGYFEPSFSTYLEMRLRKTEVRLFANLKLARVYGSQTLDVAINNNTGKAFNISTIYFGVNLANKIRISSNIPLNNINGLGGSDNYSVGVQYFIDQKKK